MRASSLAAIVTIALAALTAAMVPMPAATIVPGGNSGAREGNDEVYVMKPDGTHQTRLTTHPDTYSEPSYAPDGTRNRFRELQRSHRCAWIHSPTITVGVPPPTSGDTAASFSQYSAYGIMGEA